MCNKTYENPITFERLLCKKTDKNLITCHNRTLTQADFIAYVEFLVKEISTLLPKEDSFILIKENDAINFYALLFALWINEKKVVLPCRDNMENNVDYKFYSHTIFFKNQKLVIKKNNIFKCCSIDAEKANTICFSSGSTGTPKGIVHDKNNFIRNAVSVNHYLHISNYVSITFLKPYLVSALSHFLVHFLSDSHLVFDDINSMKKINTFLTMYPDINVVGSPIHLTMAASEMNSSFKPKFFFSSGDFIYKNAISEILKKYPKATFYKVYGLAELAGRFFINSIDSNSSVDNYTNIGSNIEGTFFEIKEDQLHVSSDFIFYGYIIDNEFNPSSKFHPTGDMVKVDNSGITLVGRIDDEIKVGGNKLSLKSIESKISDLLVNDIAIVIATTHPLLGNIISLVINTKDKKNTRKKLMALLRSELLKNEMPHKYFYIDDIPYTQSGKIDRKQIAAHLDTLPALNE